MKFIGMMKMKAQKIKSKIKSKIIGNVTTQINKIFKLEEILQILQDEKSQESKKNCYNEKHKKYIETNLQ